MSNITEMLDKLKSLIIKDTSLSENDIKNELYKRHPFLSSEQFDNIEKNIYILKYQLSFSDNRLMAYYLNKTTETHFLVCVGIDLDLISCEDFRDKWIVATHDLKIEPLTKNKFLTSSGDECNYENYVKEYIFTDSDTIDNEGFWKGIINIFPKLSFYEINDNPDCYKLFIESYIKEDHYLLNFDDNSKKALIDLVENDVKYLSYENLCYSLLANNWKYCFLNLFRNIEALFRISMVHELREKVNHSISIQEASKFVKAKMGNGHQEDQIRYLFQVLDSEQSIEKEEISKLFNLSFQNVSRKFYETRNDIVHFQFKNCDYLSYTDNDWNIIIRFSLEAIKCLYGKLEEYIEFESESVDSKENGDGAVFKKLLDKYNKNKLIEGIKTEIGYDTFDETVYDKLYNFFVNL